MCSALVRSLLRWFRLRFSLIIRATRSHVPCESLNQRHAAFMPDAISTVSRFRRDSSQEAMSFSILTSIEGITTPHQRFTHVRLIGSHLTCSSRLFQQRSPRRLLTDAACGGLTSAPADRHWKAFFHLSHSTARQLRNRFYDRALMAHPLVTFLGLMHLRITLLGRVLR